MPTTKKRPDFVTAPNPTLGSDLLDQLVAFEPLRQEVVETKLGPVSYTHLDVYKRQPSFGPSPPGRSQRSRGAFLPRYVTAGRCLPG